MVELVRARQAGLVDFLFTTTFVFVLLFGVAPLLVFFAFEAGAIPSEWSFVTHLAPTSGYYAYAVVVALAAYFLLLLGYRLGRSDQGTPERSTHSGLLVLAGVAFSLVGLMSLYLYARDIGGIQFMLETILAYRASAEPVYSRLGFLKTLSPVATGGTVLLFAAIQAGRRSVWMYVVFAFALAVSMLALVVNAGRLMTVQFLLLFPLYFLLRSSHRLLVPMCVAGLLIFGTITVFGHGMFDLFRGTERIATQFENASQGPAEIGIRVGLEFAYPVESLALTLRDVGTEPYAYRWFSDVPIGLAYLMPKRLFALELPETVSMQLSDLVRGPVPADLITFGYWSAGPMGIVIAAIGFGWLVARFEAWFPACRDPVMLTMRAAWIAYLCSRVMYGNPHHTFITALPLVLASAVIYFISRPATDNPQRQA
ncbi:MAG: hypothetical protein IRZ28_05860 [Steroidobacteraceae bacterium]|nr:hypothetical protein [Steroidobacteraceae bacterium]